MRNLLIIATLVIAPTLALAETVDAAALVDAPAPKNALGISGAFPLPVGDWGDLASVGLGAILHYDHALDDNWTLTGRIGYIWYLGSDNGLVETSYSEIPILVGAKYYFDPLAVPWADEPLRRFYLVGEAGFSMIDGTLKSSGIFGESVEVDHSSTEFAMGLGFGRSIENLDLAVRIYMPKAFDLFSLMTTVGYNFASF